jgi:hypothetical protein
MPFILALEHEGKYITGINLNVVPMQVRRKMFDVIFKIYANTIMYNTGKKHPLWHELLGLQSDKLYKLVGMKSKIAINKYSRELMVNIRSVDWESIIPATTLYMHNTVIFNAKKHLNLQTIFKSQVL